MRRSDCAWNEKWRHQSSVCSWPRRSGGKPVASSASLERRRRARLQRLVVEPGALALGGGEHLVLRRIVDDADDQLAGDLQADRDAVERDSRGRSWWCRRSDRRSTSAARRGRARSCRAFLLAEEGVVGEAAREIGLDRPLRGEVGVGDEVEAALLLDRGTSRANPPAPRGRRRAASRAASR